MWNNTSNGQQWYKTNTNRDTAVSLKTDPHRVGGGMVWSSGDIKDQQHKTTSTSNTPDTHLNLVVSKTEDSHQVKKGSLPLCWLMSFPVSKLYISCVIFISAM